MDIPLNYIIDALYRNCKNIKKKGSNTYNFSCPVCNEGKSIRTKKRGYFFIKEDYFYCQNCQKSWNPIEWLIEVEKTTYKEIMKAIREYGDSVSTIEQRINPLKEDNKPKKIYSLPYDCINLSDNTQLEYYKTNKVVQDCLRYITERKLDIAINKPKNFYITLHDKIHKNRLCIPFYDENDKIIYYQTRALYKEDEEIAKYLSKKDTEKSLCGIDKIDPNMDSIFLFEGPIDSMFCKNGCAVCGLSLTDKQKEQLDKYRLHRKIWVLDNQYDNNTVCEKYKELIDNGENVFFWPKEFKEYKDVNDICVATNRNEIPTKLFLNNTFSGLSAQMKLKELCECLNK